MTRICVGLFGRIESYEETIDNHIRLLYNCLTDYHVDVAISTTCDVCLKEACKALSPCFINTMSSTIPESKVKILEFCQGESYDFCILLNFDYVFDQYFSFNTIVTKYCDRLYIIPRNMYIETILRFRISLHHYE